MTTRKLSRTTSDRKAARRRHPEAASEASAPPSVKGEAPSQHPALNRYRTQYEQGDTLSHLAAVLYCTGCGIAWEPWMRAAWLTAFSAEEKGKSLDDRLYPRVRDPVGKLKSRMTDETTRKLAEFLVVVRGYRIFDTNEALADFFAHEFPNHDWTGDAIEKSISRAKKANASGRWVFVSSLGAQLRLGFFLQSRGQADMTRPRTTN